MSRPRGRRRRSVARAAVPGRPRAAGEEDDDGDQQQAAHCVRIRRRPGRVAAVILENGIIRTLDPQLPTARALAIAGSYIAGGVGVHESALASPETVDLGGRCVLPAFTDSHVHFPTWSLNQLQVKLDGCSSIEEALARVRDAEREPGRWLRGYGWRDGDWSLREEPTKQALDGVTGDT